ncbi:MAG: TetR/AcrR family transcriptional regulator C-terminal domain-containing protein [Hoeflea sp.]|uniref:TetR/AcrR family transcriptional regulator C-terminal domain-containing protein n=1 Tax=Hoeflea sp. TaxID=1940281 RepID=UPI001DA49D7A|nr:TetR/AcrR family transcriptional regulator C-terminal domain-containing protein [Hoeflea sp.]MBU4530206.1 TetR/AcrR family transcriptional regulator C-terminal domain-containing protein [Alphaproteobacteria bacterium]MBU4542509.1 TetR/AcrR family transcriptional regulator C-terminal domain-containing protein [Alphaproteobacteria bacterium]MBU4551190.1 TetR/AcrR family transcriptional regulator C-terminal domain-containing protein [Alphaproteobacteria bacterium]MBV1723013.1 TetR/AcrR family t
MTIAAHPILRPEHSAAATRDAAGSAAASGAEAEFSGRQREVLDVVLRLMVAEGDGFSVAAVARAASCSKETLYKWFGDRDGLLTATVRWQASKVQMPKLPRDGLTRASLSAALTGFAESWLTVITSDLSIALNRAAVSHAGSGKSRLGEIVLTNGPFAMKSRIEPLLEAGRAAGLLGFEDVADAFRSFFGLVVADTQIRLLLGDDSHPDDAEIKTISARAVTKFLGLYRQG